MKKVLVIWSGGLDSTYLIQKNLEEGNIVKTISINIKNNYETQGKYELSSRKVLKNILKKMYGDKIEYLDDISIDIPYVNSNLTLMQPLLWLIGSAYTSKSIDEVQIGYVQNDDALSYLDEIRSIYNTFSKISRVRLPTLKFPLIKYKKIDIQNLIDYKLNKHVWFCENSLTNKPCGECPSCKRHYDN